VSVIAVIVGITAAVTFWLQPTSSTGEWDPKIDAVLIYSHGCAHCETLLKYLQEKNAFAEINIVRTTDPSKYIPLLSKMNITFSGVPTLIAYLPDANLPAEITTKPYVIMVGFPSESQLGDGYFSNEDFDRSHCLGAKGIPYYEDNKYLFCILQDGTILGNAHAIDWIIEKIKQFS